MNQIAVSQTYPIGYLSQHEVDKIARYYGVILVPFDSVLLPTYKGQHFLDGNSFRYVADSINWFRSSCSIICAHTGIIIHRGNIGYLVKFCKQYKYQIVNLDQHNLDIACKITLTYKSVVDYIEY